MDKAQQMMMEELKSGGAYPTGSCSAWPQERNNELKQRWLDLQPTRPGDEPRHADGVAITGAGRGHRRVNASLGEMARGLVKSAGQAIVNGKVSEEIRSERYATCKACPFFIEDSKRCSECGCFMEAKTWIGGDPKSLCPQQKWSR